MWWPGQLLIGSLRAFSKTPRRVGWLWKLSAAVAGGRLAVRWTILASSRRMYCVA